MNAIITDYGALVIAVSGIALWYVVARAKLNFEKKRYEFDQNERDEISRFRRREERRLSDTSKEVGSIVANNLRNEPDWARQALEDAKILPYKDTVFGERSRHFQKEKAELAKYFVPYLIARCKAMTAESDRKVFLMIDSGTTLYPFFELIADAVVQAYTNREDWIDRVNLVTNNLPGFEKMMTSGKRVESLRHSDLAIKCYFLGGKALPIYAAVGGVETSDAIRELRAKHDNDKTTFISLVVGNWVRLRDSTPRIPVPMVRDDDHRIVKQALVEASHEVFVISPLGKVFVNKSLDNVNEALGLKTHVGAGRPLWDPEAYDELNITDDVASTVKLVSTKRRTKKRLLYTHSVEVQSALGEPSMINAIDFAAKAIEDVPHLIVPLKERDFPRRTLAEFEMEFPHDYTWTEDVLSLFINKSSPEFKKIKDMGFLQ